MFDFEDFLLGLAGCLVVILFVLVGWAAIKDDQDWQIYAAAHHCRPAGTREGAVSTGLTSNGKLTTSVEPDQTIYACDAGEIHIR